jgi:hypothetical protein
MDNGQHISNLSDPFAESITVGVGISPETGNQPADDNLNMENFGVEAPDRLNDRGRGALNAIHGRADGLELAMPPTSQSEVRLGQIVDMMTPPSAISSRGAETNAAVDSDKTSMDSEIARHLADGKVNENDVSYLKNKTEELVNDPVALGEFIMKARQAIAKKSSGDPK